MKVAISKEAHFIAHYLAKFANAYDSLGFGNITKTHKVICDTLDMKESSFRRLRDEYDGFYDNRTGFPNPESRTSRVDYKNQFQEIGQEEYIAKISSILFKNIYDINFDEQIHANPLYEGEKIRIEINKFERSSEAKKKCIAYYRRECVLCGFKDENSVYKEIDIIEVHHVKALSKIQKNYIVDPIGDLRPVCPNCHRALHSKKPPYSIEELEAVITK